MLHFELNDWSKIWAVLIRKERLAMLSTVSVFDGMH